LIDLIAFVKSKDVPLLLQYFEGEVEVITF